MTSTISYRARKPDRLFDQARAGDPLALGPLLASYAYQLRRIADHQLDEKLRNRVSPSDIVQETLLQAGQDFQDFRGQSDAEFGSWLRRILARKLSKNIERHLLAEKRDVRREVGLGHASGAYRLPAQDAVADHRPGPASEAMQYERSRHIEQALATLPETYRQIVELRNVQGLPFDEVARRLNRTSGAARMLWLRAIDALRQQLNQRDSI